MDSSLYRNSMHCLTVKHISTQNIPTKKINIDNLWKKYLHLACSRLLLE